MSVGSRCFRAWRERVTVCVDNLVLVTSLVPRFPCNRGGDLKILFLSILWESLCGNEARCGAKTSHIATHTNTVRCSPTGCLYSGGSEHRSILPESREMVKLSPRGSRIPVMVTGEGELPSIASGEREEGEGDREQRLMVVICGG